MSNTKQFDDTKSFVDHFNEMRPFNQLLGLSIQSPDFNHSYMKFKVKDEFCGNPVYGTLHGGVISAVLDVAGGHAVCLNVVRKVKEQNFEKIVEKLAKVSTIDMRIDYLRPGKGELFTADGWILRSGNKVAVARAELRNEEDKLIAVGTGTYTVG